MQSSPRPGTNSATALTLPTVAVLGKVMETPTHLRSHLLIVCRKIDGWCQEGKGGVSGVCEKGRGSFHLPEYFGQWTLIILLSWAGKGANLVHCMTLGLPSSPPDQELLHWNSSVNLQEGGGPGRGWVHVDCQEAPQGRNRS